MERGVFIIQGLWFSTGDLPPKNWLACHRPWVGHLSRLYNNMIATIYSEVKRLVSEENNTFMCKENFQQILL